MTTTPPTTSASTLTQRATICCWSVMVISIGVLAFSALCLGCGGGGGGGEAGDESLVAPRSGFVSMQAQPDIIDTGNRLIVQLSLQEIHEDGIILKVRYPLGLNYFPDSATMFADGEAFNIEPSTNQASQDPEEEADYLVFFLPRVLFGFRNQARVSFQLIGVIPVESGAIEVDLDLNNSFTDDDKEFDIADPQFSPDDQVSIEVSG